MSATFCTAVAAHQLAPARVLAADLARHGADGGLTVLLLDGDVESLSEEPFEVVGVDELDEPSLGLFQMVASDPVALGAALRPALLGLLVERSGGPVVWLEPTTRVFGPLDELVEASSDGLAVVAVQASLEGPPVGVPRSAFEGGAVAATDPAALRWWAAAYGERARRAGTAFEPLADDALAALVGARESVAVLRSSDLIAGWWTLAAGAELGEGPTLDGRPLRAFDFAGFDPRRPWWLSDEDAAGAVRASERPALAQLLATHADELEAAGWEPPPDRWRYDVLPNGLAIDDDMRDLFAVALRSGAELGSPFEEDGCAAFMRWLDSESPIGGGVTWYLERVHRRRADLQVAYPDLAGGDNLRLAAWMHEHGVEEEPVVAELMRGRAEAPASSTPERPDAPGASVQVVGYLRDGLGIGQAARSYANALRSAGVEVDTVSVRAPMEGHSDARALNRRHVEWEDGGGGGAPAAVEIVCMNPPELLRAHRSGAISAERGYRIGVWAWELDTLPPDWSGAFPLVDEVWAYSEYVATALRAQAPVPVEVMPLAIDIPVDAEPPAPGEPFTFLFVFDFRSTIERKNPLGLIDAFTRAFEPGEGPRLLIKTSNGDNDSQDLERLRVAALGRPDVEIRDEFLPAAERDALVAGCGCYVSLHRAEGFGLTIAEAMAAGRPAIATAYSGNLDFMSGESSYLVDWTPAEVEAGSRVYPAGARWAEPDLDQAARLMREVYDDRAAAADRGRAGRAHVERALAPAVVGERMRIRLDQIKPSRKGIIGSLARRVRS